MSVETERLRRGVALRGRRRINPNKDKNFFLYGIII